MPPAIAAVTIENRWVRIEPLHTRHVDGLEAAITDPDETFRWMPAWHPGATGLTPIIDGLAEKTAAGQAVVWAIRRLTDDRLVGSTSYTDIDLVHGGLEVGGTWVGRHWWRTEVNTATKLLVLGHAFDTLGIERVALKTDHLNTRSQRAIERLGARREGVLRHHRLRPDGTWRDSVYYSILRAEWPAVRDRLHRALGAPTGP